ncbi:hypothetical protein KJ657_04345 [Patescibacteria group bacterium]|nr:hypothetical protein [Patescibacteria group bacterium]MBU1016294.1 hypothetical protein [Patescibacteria group bacterium]MBU1685570.1 hypothetical protein [Patescibacteria group bacterium]MBU1938495.1 hypothetical protein [Patescibacteria group bacterium]
MDRFLHLKYYFIPLPDPNFQFTKLTILIGLLMILAGIALGIYRKKYLKDPIARKILKIYPGRLRLFGFLVLLLLIFREQGIPYLSMRLWWFVILIMFLYSFLKLAFSYKKEYSRRKERVKKNISRHKYLPKKKR